MADRFKGGVVIVTGGSKGIGEGCARVFTAEGGHVVICARGAEDGERVAKELNDKGPGTCAFMQADVSKPADIKRVVDDTVARYGRLDCMINNAGWHPPAIDIEEMPIKDFEALLRLNLTSTYAGCKFALPHLLKTKGSIVNMSSMVGILGQAKATAYCATKAGQIGITKALAVDYAPKGVRVNAVLPAGVDTPLMRDWASTLDDPEAALRWQGNMHLLGRLATIEEIGRVCLFLASEDASFVTGQAIQVEGGASLDYSPAC